MYKGNGIMVQDKHQICTVFTSLFNNDPYSLREIQYQDKLYYKAWFKFNFIYNETYVPRTYDVCTHLEFISVANKLEVETMSFPQMLGF